MAGRMLAIAKKFKRELAVYKRLLSHVRTPKVAKWILAIAIGYALMPFDLIPDFIPIIGLIDDAVILPFLIWLAIRLIPNDVVLECRNEIERED